VRDLLLHGVQHGPPLITRPRPRPPILLPPLLLPHVVRRRRCPAAFKVAAAAAVARAAVRAELLPRQQDLRHERHLPPEAYGLVYGLWSGLWSMVYGLWSGLAARAQ
jgi:hypothetical protein